MPRLMEIRKQHGFPQPFGKASQKTLCFTTFSTASTAGSHSTRFRPSLYADNSVLNFWEKSPVGRAHSSLLLTIAIPPVRSGAFFVQTVTAE